jgi:hypothetical protein
MPACLAELETSFAQELKRRGIDSPSDSEQPGTGPKVPGRSGATVEDPSASLTEDQLKKSRALSSEGLEGLLPRASMLVRVGGTFFLGFLPFILVVSLLFSALYWVRCSLVTRQSSSLAACLVPLLCKVARAALDVNQAGTHCTWRQHSLRPRW